MSDFIGGYPKYQYSVFLKGSRDEQIVIRADDWEEFKALKTNVDAIVDKHKEEALESRSEAQKHCPNCGEPMEIITGTTKTGKNKGKPWKAWGCTAKCGVALEFIN